jgi:hypothetical protein
LDTGVRGSAACQSRESTATTLLTQVGACDGRIVRIKPGRKGRTKHGSDGVVYCLVRSGDESEIDTLNSKESPWSSVVVFTVEVSLTSGPCDPSFWVDVIANIAPLVDGSEKI